VLIDELYGLFIPNAFSPLAGPEGVRSFRAIGIGLREFHIAVYNTWGNVIWESSDLDEHGVPTGEWNGITPSGEMGSQDAYVWKARGVFRNGVIWPGMEYKNTTRTSGTVTLIR
jgi:hypothetical protein